MPTHSSTHRRTSAYCYVGDYTPLVEYSRRPPPIQQPYVTFFNAPGTPPRPANPTRNSPAGSNPSSPLLPGVFNPQGQTETASPPPAPTSVHPPRLTPVAPMPSKSAMPPPSPTAVTKGNGGGGGGGGGGGVSSGLDGDKTGGVAGKVGGKGGGAGTIKIPGRRGPPTKFLTTLHDMLIAGNPQIWWERETGAPHSRHFLSSTFIYG